MTAYLVSDIIEVTDPGAMSEYGEAAQATIADHGGTILAFGAGEALEGSWVPGTVVLVSFDSMEALKAWYDSPEYQAALPIRHGASRANVIVFDGV